MIKIHEYITEAIGSFLCQYLQFHGLSVYILINCDTMEGIYKIKKK